MLTILLHSSKTMRSPAESGVGASQPPLLAHAAQLAGCLKTLTMQQITESMRLSPSMAERTHTLIANWQPKTEYALPAIDAFIGDIYSGLQVATLSPSDRTYAHDHLYILSGLYGVVRALDSVSPYRLEMGYRLPDPLYRNLYAFWGDHIAKALPQGQPIINLSAVEYTRAVFPHFPDDTVIITPKFLTVSPKTSEPTFVTVHAKIARGAFAHWLITQRTQHTSDLAKFDELGYRYSTTLSTPEQPVFVCQQFGGLGMSVRLAK